MRRFRFTKKARKKITDIMFICVMLCVLLFIYSSQVLPALSVSAASYLNNRVYVAVNDSILSYLEATQYDSFIELTYSSDGKVSSIEAKVNEINMTRANVSRALLSELKNGSINEIKLPVGCIFGNELAYAKGPALTFKCISNDSFLCGVESDFFESGINQTVHRLYLDFSVDITVSMPLKNITVPVDVRYMLSEVVIVGDVPDSYTKINRFFDDISESEIDDIYDFGADS